MSRPATTPIAEEIYARLAPIATQDEALGWPLLTYVLSVSQMFTQVESLVRAVDPLPAWSQALDVDRTPAEFVTWLGQFVGVQVKPGLTAAAQRTQVHDLNTLKRGTVAALIAAVQQTLTGTKSVRVDERKGTVASLIQRWDGTGNSWDSYGAATWDSLTGFVSTQAFSITVTVRASECPSLSATTAAAEAAKMSGLLLTVVVDGEYSWDQEVLTWDGTGTTTWDNAATVPL